jgi:hypothetical protein
LPVKTDEPPAATMYHKTESPEGVVPLTVTDKERELDAQVV